MEFEIEDSFKMKIDQIIAKDDAERCAPMHRHSSIISPGKSEAKTALPLPLYEIMINMPDIAVDNPYNRLITAIELLEDIEKEEIMCSAENISQQKPYDY